KIKKNTDVKQLMSKIYKHTEMELNYHCDYWVIYEDKPYHLGTDDILLKWMQFRAKTIKRVKEYELEGNNKKLHVLYGLQKVLLDIDKAIDIIKNSEDSAMISNLQKAFSVDEEQAKIVADIKLRNLTKTYIEGRTREIKQLESNVLKLKNIINNKKEIAKIMLDELAEIKAKYSEERQTKIVDKEEIVVYNETAESKVEEYNVRVFVTKDNYIKKIPLTSLRGDFAIKTKHDDEVILEVETTNSEEVLIFTDKRNVYKKKLHELPDSKPSDLGVYLPSSIGITNEETILSVIPLSEKDKYILIGFEDGKVAKVDVDSYRTKQNRSVLRNGYADKTPILFKAISEDVDLITISTNEKAVLMNTDTINSKSSKTTQGTTFIKLKTDNIVREYIVEPEIEDKEYYRL